MFPFDLDANIRRSVGLILFFKITIRSTNKTQRAIVCLLIREEQNFKTSGNISKKIITRVNLTTKLSRDYMNELE